jgi:hypothetical protein
MKVLTTRSVRALVLILYLASFSFQLNASAATQPPPPDRDPFDVNRKIQFAGVTWGVRNGWGSPGPNEFSDSVSSVWVDSSGRLHLKIRYENGTWYAAEVFSTSRARYGPHTFYVVKQNPSLGSEDPNLVFGLFLYKIGCGPDCHDELDIEISRWRHPGAFNNAQYVAQPAHLPGNKHPFRLSLVEPLSTHRINWQRDWVEYSSYVGGSANIPQNRLQTWTYFGEDIPSVSENVIVVIDFWMDAGVPPANGQEAEVVIADAGISTLCRPVSQLTCGETVSDRTDEPGARDQVDSYNAWPWPEPGPEVAYSFTSPITGTISLLLSNNLEDQDVFVLDGSGGSCSSYNTLITGGNEVASFEAGTGKTYYILADSHREGGGGYDLMVDCSGASPPSDPEKFPLRLYLPFARR